VLVYKDSLRLIQDAGGRTGHCEESNTGKLKVVDSDKNSITVVGEFIQSSTSDVQYKFRFNKDGTAKMFPTTTAGEPTTDLVDSRINDPYRITKEPTKNTNPPSLSQSTRLIGLYRNESDTSHLIALYDDKTYSCDDPNGGNSKVYGTWDKFNYNGGVRANGTG
jgi:hypothetical protein